MSTTFAQNDQGFEVTSRSISDVQYAMGELLFSTYHSSHDDLVRRALNESADTGLGIGFVAEFSIDDLVTHIIDDHDSYPDKHIEHLLALARIDLLDAIKKIDNFLKVSPPHLLLFPGNTPPVTDSSPDAH